MKDYCKHQVMRMAGLDGFPLQAAPIQELVDALIVSETNESAKTVIDDFMENSIRCPKPAEIRQAARSARDRAKEQERERVPTTRERYQTCRTCKDDANVLNKETGMYERCQDCRNGRIFPQNLLGILNSPRSQQIRKDKAAGRPTGPLSLRDIVGLGVNRIIPSNPDDGDANEDFR